VSTTIERPVDAATDTRFQSDGKCVLELTLAARG